MLLDRGWEGGVGGLGCVNLGTTVYPVVVLRLRVHAVTQTLTPSGQAVQCDILETRQAGHAASQDGNRAQVLVYKGSDVTTLMYWG